MKLHLFLYTLFVLLSAVPTTSFGFCFEAAGRHHGVNPVLLRNIARTESNLNPAAVNINSDGTLDLGLMQINSQWLQKFTISENKLLSDACFNVETGARILRSCIDRHGYTWEAVGCYNAHNREKRVSYAWKIFHQIKKETISSELKGQNTLNSSSRNKGGRERSSLIFHTRDMTEMTGVHP